MGNPILYLSLFLILLISSVNGGKQWKSMSHRFMPSQRPHIAAIGNCAEKYYTQDIDHFGFAAIPGGNNQYQQRYFVCADYWDKTGPIFFYAGNEADVTLYLNATGLMWENAPQFKALLIFAEHRYFGKSLPFGESMSPSVMNWLSAEQAIEDYVTLIEYLRETLPAPNNAFIGFGGSYGGMLGAWMRIKYPSALDGVIAASAPILSFLGLTPPYNTDSFAQIMTTDASPACRSGIRTAWNIIQNLAPTAAGRTQLTNSFKLCQPLANEQQAMDLFNWASSAISYLAMGNFPYSTSYITNGGCSLPAWPFNLACGYFNNSSSNEQILEGLRNFAGVFLNCTGKLTCFDLYATVNNETERDGRLWDYLWCTGIQQPFSQNGVTDMFWPAPYNLNDSIADCKGSWGVTPRILYPLINYGGQRLQYASNIVFSNGALDPWHGGGVLTSPNPSVIALIINNAAHHLDLMFSNPLDPPEVKQARQVELQNIQKWITEKKSKVDALNPIQ